MRSSVARTIRGPYVESGATKLVGENLTSMQFETGLFGLKLILCVEPDPEIKNSRPHYKILLKLTEICWK